MLQMQITQLSESSFSLSIGQQFRPLDDRIDIQKIDSYIGVVD